LKTKDTELSGRIDKLTPPKCIPPGGDKLQFNGTNWLCVCVNSWTGATCEVPPSPPPPPPSPPPNCLQIQAPVRGFMGDCEQDMTHGSSCTFTCEDGYYIDGNTTCSFGNVFVGICKPKPVLWARFDDPTHVGKDYSELAIDMEATGDGVKYEYDDERGGVLRVTNCDHLQSSSYAASYPRGSSSYTYAFWFKVNISSINTAYNQGWGPAGFGVSSRCGQKTVAGIGIAALSRPGKLNTGHWCDDMFGGAGSNDDSLGSNVADGTWHHVTVTYDGATGIEAIYEDFAQLAWRNQGFLNIQPGKVYIGDTSQLLIGLVADDVKCVLSPGGLIDDFVLFNRALSHDEIATMGDIPSPPPSPPPSLPWARQQKLTASDGAVGDYFGYSVSVSGDYAVVGARDDDNGSGSGSAYVFVRSGATWTQQQKLAATDGAASDYFGWSVSIAGDYAIVGAYGNDDKGSNSGSAYVFVRSGMTWTQQQKFMASDGAAGDHFGFFVSISGDYAVVGAPGAGSNQGSVYVFVRSEMTWTQQQKLTATDGAASDYFGWSVSVSGDYAVVGARDDDNGSGSGSAYVFVRSGATWTQQQKLTATDGAWDDRFGHSVSISGDYAVVGAFNDGDKGSYSGSAYVFVRSGVMWTQQQKLTASDGAAIDRFGRIVSISGDYAVIGAYSKNSETGSAYMFVRSGVTWTQQIKLTASDGAAGDYFGASVSVSGDYVIVGAYGDDDKGSISGSAYVFALSSVPAIPSFASDGSSLRQAIDNCVIANATGNCDCSSSAVDCKEGNDVPIALWNVSQVTNMADVFAYTEAFNADISAWNTAKVTNMGGAFRDATAFNADISAWNTAAVTNMRATFYNAAAFNADISGWNIAAVTDMGYTFYNAAAFTADISAWNTVKVTNMFAMFYNAAAFNADITAWNTAAVMATTIMFKGATAFHARFVCDDVDDGPPSSCVVGNDCDASEPPADGSGGDCTDSLASGSTCQPTCDDGYVVSGVTACVQGTLHAAACDTPPLPKSQGDNFVCAVRGGVLYCWGRNLRGNLGVGDFVDRSAPTAVTSTTFGSRSIRVLGVGGFHACVLLNDNTVQCWGYNADGQLGLGDDRSDKTTPVNVANFGSGRVVKSIALGLYHTCAILDDGSVKCWGSNYHGELGIGTTDDTGVPTAVDLGSGRSAKTLVCSGYVSCAILDDESLKCWGNNEHGGLGDGTTTERRTPVALPSFSPVGVKDLSAGGSSCVLLNDNTVQCWGYNADGQLGLGDDRSDKTTPVNVANFGSGRVVKSIALGLYHTCAILDDGSVKCWGRNSAGQLGIGTTDGTGVPTAVDLGSGRSALALSLGGYLSCAALDDGSIKCWGWNPQGQVGDGTKTDRNTPTTVIFP